MKIEGKHKCEECNHEYEWWHQVTQENSGYLFDVETVPKNKVVVNTVVKAIKKNGYRIPLEVNAYCPNCGNFNSINVKVED
ncbi:hypothetical protein RBU61_14175 [Tissierella sp. MB52-C2]|uniref:hypothetical protein n=1 Tax=Tissierella sp. MB52-C2 TaxID=3070999 RepID=UPI00280B2A8B|nr:hypothetical protein [Tissierella sp. MB52-C2]WMM24062.1 hypothetical protein RBU61_14175 [Tissierella sp. MB52-C2]